MAIKTQPVSPWAGLALAAGVTCLLTGSLGEPPWAPISLFSAAAQSALGWSLIALGGAGFRRQPVRRSLGLNAPAPPVPLWIQGLWALGLVSLSLGINTLISMAGWATSGTLFEIQQTMTRMPADQWGLALLTLDFAPALSEELLFRGLLLGLLLGRSVKPGTAILLSSLAFGVAHLDPVHGVAATLLGVYLGTVAWAARSIRPAILAHAANNGVALLGASGLVGETTLSSTTGWAIALGAAIFGAAALWTLVRRIRSTAFHRPVATDCPSA